MQILGIDVGGWGIKGAPVDVKTGQLLAPRCRLPTPGSAKPRPVAKIVKHFDWHGPVGCGFPAALRDGVALTSANIHEKWIGTNAAALFAEMTGCLINNADAAGLAEMAFGAGRGVDRYGRHWAGHVAVHRRSLVAQHRVGTHRDPR